jgi:NAD(P)-dependent dehydrogenase (short-subunit alcohol dehydrogenase family)
MLRNAANGLLSFPDMAGKVVVISGATSGIGQAAAEKLASLGARIVLVARSPERAAHTLSRLGPASPPDVRHGVHLADLSLVADTMKVARELADAEPRVDVLVNNAGGLYFSRQVTSEGLERTFALNHMSYFLLAEGLRPSLVRGARIVNTASEAHRAAPARLDDLPDFTESGFRAYARTKAFNILFTRALARRLEDSDIPVNCFHPGLVPTRLFGEHGVQARVLGLAARLTGVSVEKGADTLVYLAASDGAGLGTGGYFSKRQRRPTTAFANDLAAAERLWTLSEQIRDRHRAHPG